MNNYAIDRNKDKAKLLMMKYPDIELKEICWCLHFNMKERPKCPVCGNVCTFDGNYSHLSNTNNGYFLHCSNKCAQLDSEVQSKIELTKLKKYGDKKWNNSKQIVSTYSSRHGGIGFASNKVRELTRKRLLEKYGSETYNNVEKIKETKQVRYGDENYANHQKYVETCIKKYGVTNYWASKECREKCNSLDSRIKAWNTRCKNGNLKSSSYEDIIYNYIKTIYSDEIVRNDRKALDGYELDIFLPKLNLGIEINGDFFHANPLFYTAVDTVNLPGKGKVYATQIWERDFRKIKLAKCKNINVITVWSNDIDENLLSVQNMLGEEILLTQLSC